MARISSWISHNSVENYPTHIIRQLYQPPFAEFLILHINLLSGSDFFSNSVQFWFMLFTLAAITTVAKSLGLNAKFQYLTALLVISLPEVVLQSSSTQNDLVITFFVIAAMYFAIKAVTYHNLHYYLPFGLATGLAMLTKGTAYIYLFPVLLIAALYVLYKIVKYKIYIHLVYGITALIIAATVNIPHWQRNYTLTGSVLGVDKNESRLYANEHMSGMLLLSNLIKNGGLHIGIKGDSHISNFTDTIIHKLHSAVNINVDDPALNYLKIKYSTQASAAHEDSARNPFQFILIIIAFIVVTYHALKNRKHAVAAVLMFTIILQVLLFCAYLKWQPWHSRLHITMFVLALPVICYAASISNLFKKTVKIILPIILLYATLIVIDNNLRPLKPAYLRQDRYQKYFVAKPDAYYEYLTVKKQIEQSDFKNIGLIIGADDWQYPLFADCYSQTINPVHINVSNYTVKAGKRGNIDCIVSTTINKPKITYRGKDFYNQNPQNKIISIYK
ncbi:ArnT family glycosyltransferase [Mucilaginibacter limnophilus]|nr:glycosyltransferase family 39 protein [Mucilaginibacter limnophilus]